MSGSGEDAAAVDAARAQAEARRKRILEKAGKRMGVVSGEQVQADEEEKESGSKAARIRAARQRRYGKKTPETSATPEGSLLLDETQFLAKESRAADVKTNVEKTMPVVDPSDVGGGTESESSVGPASSSPTSIRKDDPANESVEKPKKKYVGVARMRRNLIEKKKREDETDRNEHDATTSFVSREETVDKLQKLPADVLKTNAIPAYMHIVTILLLFLSGIDISLREYNKEPDVSMRYAFDEHGIPLIHSRTATLPPEDEDIPQVLSLPASRFMIDEFEDDEVVHTANVDPLFGVDLDQLTRGPGIMRQLARGAVGAHRMIMWLLYYLPLRSLQTLFTIPSALLHNPPVLCVVSLALRHLIGKGLLGAGIPDSTIGEDKGNAIDVIAIAKNFISNLMTSNFPTTVSLYGAFVHLRSDMYILWFGFLSGLVWDHWLSTTTISEVQKYSTNEL